MPSVFRFCTKGMHLAVLLIAAGLLMVPAPSFAQAVGGCNPEDIEVQKAMAETQVSENMAIDDEIFVQDDSVLALTCFNQTAAISAKQAGDVFSGDFRAELRWPVETTLRSLYSNYNNTLPSGTPNTSLGVTTKTVDYDDATAGTLDTTSDSMTYKCDGIRALWDAVNNAGVASGAPYTTREERLRNASDPASGPAYQAARSNPATQSRRNAARGLVAARTPPTVMPTPLPDASLCGVLRLGGVIRVTATCIP